MRALILFLLSLLACSPSFALGIKEGIPHGFEQLATAKPSMLVVFYGGDILGTFPVHITPQQLVFDSPAAVTESIPALKDKAVTRQALAQPLPLNIDQLCTLKRVEHCGRLNPETVGIIYDEAHLSAELFVASSLLTEVDTRGERYLPVPKTADLSSVYGFRGAVNGSDIGTPVYTLSNNSTFSLGEKKLTTQTSATNQGVRFDQAALSAERNGTEASAGLLPSKPMQLISDRDIIGASYSTSRRTVLDTHKDEGNNILLYLPRQAFVSIYREGRLYSSRSYDAGNQQIDTSELPEGAYNLTLKIQEADGSTRTELRFFAKNLELPPPGSPTYYAQAGMIRKPAGSDSTIPQITGDPMVRVGSAYRLDDNLGVNSSVLGLRDRAITETGLFWVHSGLQLRGVGLVSTAGDLGAGASAFYTAPKLSATVDVRQVWLTNAPLPGYSDMSHSYMQASGNLAYAVDEKVTLGVRGSYSRQDASVASSSLGPYAEWRIWQAGERMLGVSAAGARTNNQTQGNILLNFSYRLGENGVSGTLGNGFGNQSQGQFGNVRAWHEHQNEAGEHVQLGGGVSGDRKTQTFGADAEWRNQIGQVNGSIQKNVGENNGLNYGGSFSVNAAQMSDDVFVGGAESDSSAVVIDTAGDVSGKLNVFVNNSPRSMVTIGDKRVIYLSPFHSYSIRVAPQGDALLDLDSAERKVTLYPGNVVRLHWDVRQQYVISAKLVAEDGAPLAGALLQDSLEVIETSALGRLQAEITHMDQLRFMLRDGSACAVTLPASTQTSPVHVYTQPLTCHVDTTQTVAPGL